MPAIRIIVICNYNDAFQDNKNEIEKMRSSHILKIQFFEIYCNLFYSVKKNME